jgi:hypothetical protein
VTIALVHDAPAPGVLPAGSAPADATARGWVARSDGASRVVLPDDRDAERLVAARAEVLLAGAPDVGDDPVGHVLALAELGRLGELDATELDAVVPDVAAAVNEISRHAGWDVDAALDAASWLLARAGEDRAARDLERIRAGRPEPVEPPVDEAGVRAVAAIERRLARGGVLLPHGIPAAWRGANVEAHGLPAGPRSTVSFAVRWHGDNAAVLWEVEGDPVELTAPAVDPSWRTRATSGEALWRLDR